MPDTSKVTVNVLCGKPAIAQYASWRRDEEPMSEEVGSALKTFEFDTEKEAAAFIKGMQAGASWNDVMHLSPQQAAAIQSRIDRTRRASSRA